LALGVGRRGGVPFVDEQPGWDECARPTAVSYGDSVVVDAKRKLTYSRNDKHSEKAEGTGLLEGTSGVRRSLLGR
jgi:hypothetical protein